MPVIKPLSEFTRNQNATIDELAASREPIYLTRNGNACVVVMNAEAFDEAMAFRNELREQEMRTYASILKGMRDIAEGRYMNADDADAAFRESVLGSSG